MMSGSSIPSVRPRGAFRVVVAAVGVLSMSLLISLAGCGAGPSPVAEPEPRIDDLAQPAVRGATNGLEMRVWAVQDQDELIAELLATYGDRPTAMPDSARSAWRESGLRVIEVPTEHLSLVRDRIVLIGPEQRDWFGQSPGWTEAVRGRLIESDTTMRVADGVLTAPAGRLRLLMRCWTVPGEPARGGGAEAALHLELAAQLERRDAAASIMELPALRSELEAGVVFPRLTTTMRLSSGSALVIIPVGPGFEAAFGEADTGFGPPEPAVPTLGEAMLTSLQTGAIVPARRRALVALVPRLPERFRVTRDGSAPAEPALARSDR